MLYKGQSKVTQMDMSNGSEKTTSKTGACNITYCKFGIFREDFIFAKLRMRSFVKIKTSRNGKITLSFNDIGKSCLSRDFFTSLICLLLLFAKIKFSRKFPNLQYTNIF